MVIQSGISRHLCHLCHLLSQFYSAAVSWRDLNAPAGCCLPRTVNEPGTSHPTSFRVLQFCFMPTKCIAIWENSLPAEWPLVSRWLCPAEFVLTDTTLLITSFFLTKFCSRNNLLGPSVNLSNQFSDKVILTEIISYCSVSLLLFQTAVFYEIFVLVACVAPYLEDLSALILLGNLHNNILSYINFWT